MAVAAVAIGVIGTLAYHTYKKHSTPEQSDVSLNKKTTQVWQKVIERDQDWDFPIDDGRWGHQQVDTSGLSSEDLEKPGMRDVLEQMTLNKNILAQVLDKKDPMRKHFEVFGGVS